MKIIILSIIFMMSLEASEGYYKKTLRNCDLMYSLYKINYSYASSSCLKLGKVDRASLMIEEAQDEIDFLEFQQKTLGIACEQVKNGIPVSFKNDYCARIMNSSTVQQESKISTSSNSDMLQQNDKESNQVNRIDPAIEYKNSPQLQMNKLQIYGVNNLSYFRDRLDIIMVESSTGNFAVPKTEIINAKRINFTPQLSEKIDTLTK